LTPGTTYRRRPTDVCRIAALPSVDRNDSRVWRLLDANANRAREGLRVVEDTARFVLDRADAAKALRKIRHDVDALVRTDYKILLKHRDVAADSGKKNESAPYKAGIPDLLAANFKRCEEALRVLEEYGRFLSKPAVKKAQSLRFQVYRWEKKMLVNGFRDMT
jgi:thiamine-phosphate pyrophosphorylase